MDAKNGCNSRKYSLTYSQILASVEFSLIDYERWVHSGAEGRISEISCLPVGRCLRILKLKTNLICLFRAAKSVHSLGRNI
jgi:hypothetical protein